MLIIKSNKNIIQILNKNNIIIERSSIFKQRFLVLVICKIYCSKVETFKNCFF